jgi:hypothetical protein
MVFYHLDLPFLKQIKIKMINHRREILSEKKKDLFLKKEQTKNRIHLKIEFFFVLQKYD